MHVSPSPHLPGVAVAGTLFPLVLGSVLCTHCHPTVRMHPSVKVGTLPHRTDNFWPVRTIDMCAGHRLWSIYIVVATVGMWLIP